ncbi:zf-TFIIB domain-containing protein [candidate division KSB1 bacterium]|nr:zf-TFIIB domain-containing protein [candidate division KSB1 bacterium]
MNCPKCSSEMISVNFDGIEVDRCTKCRGIWFDMLEAIRLKERDGSEIIDTGEPRIGEQYNKIDHINCPVCDEPLLRMVDAKHPHIWYEECSLCHGTFFDAGEFKDFKDRQWSEFIKDLMTKK